MKFIVSMKDPDTLHDAIEEAVKEELTKIADVQEDERELLLEKRIEKVSELCRKWFEYGEYLVVEIDTDAKTCIVVEKE